MNSNLIVSFSKKGARILDSRLSLVDLNLNRDSSWLRLASQQFIATTAVYYKQESIEGALK